MVGKQVLNESDFARRNFTASFTQSPPGLNLTGSYSVPGNGPWYVKLSTPLMSPDPQSGTSYYISITDTRDVPSPLLFPNTLSPIGNESVFLPKLNFTPALPTKKQSRALDWLEYNELTIPDKMPIYVDYSASPSVEVRGGSNIRGFNEWKEHDDASIGNSYSDGFLWSHAGESHGWLVGNGEITAGEMGIYPNLSYSEWQKAIQRAQQVS